MNTYQVQVFPEGFVTNLPPVITVQAEQFTTTEDYVVFIDASSPPQGLMMVPFSLNPLIIRTATA
jgi:hypothetical protein